MRETLPIRRVDSPHRLIASSPHPLISSSVLQIKGTARLRACLIPKRRVANISLCFCSRAEKGRVEIQRLAMACRLVALQRRQKWSPAFGS